MFNFSIRADAHNTTDEFGEPREPNGEFVSFEDVCRQFNYTLEDEDFEDNPDQVEIPPHCLRTNSPLDFVYDRTWDIYNLTEEAFEDDEDLLL